MAAGGLDAGTLQQHQNAAGGAGLKSILFADQQPADVPLVEAVDILLRVDRGDYLFLINLLRRRRLHENAVDFRIGVQFGDQGKHLLHRRVGGEHPFLRIDAKLGALLHLGIDVDLRCGIVADQHHRQSGRTPLRLQRFHPARGLLVDLPGNLLAVDNFRRHDTLETVNF